MNDQTKVALVTGATRGIGKAIVIELVKQGVHVVFTYLNSEQLAGQVESEARQFGVAEGVRIDSKDAAAVGELVKSIADKHGKIDILIHNAGIKRDALLPMMKDQDWADVLDTNLTGFFHYAKHCSFYMLKRKSGRIISLSSISGIYGLPGQTNYSASKAGLIGLSRALSKELAAYQIPVNVIAPGGVESDMTEQMPEHKRAELLSAIPAKRFATPEEVANVAAYLALHSPVYLTGSVIVLDGGMGIG